MRQTFLDYLDHFIGLPYIWGGDDPVKGFDCSGLVLEGLKAVGSVSRDYDTTADGLLKLFSAKKVEKPSAGVLVFWGSNGRATHVEICVSDKLTLGASGGGSKTLTELDAIKHNGYVKIRPIRDNYIAMVDPFA